jgi:sulfate adenylyltransferase subunit 2
LDALEAESIYIIREVAAQFARPVMLYSIGKDSSVMLHLARKAFWLAKPPFPLLHVDTTWKFREMMAFRDRAAEFGLDLIVHVNEEGLRAGIGPFTHGAALHTEVIKTEVLKQALERHGFDAALGGARRDEEKSRAKERIFSFRSTSHRWDARSQWPELWKLYNGGCTNAKACVSFRCRTGPSLTSGNTGAHRGGAALFREGAPRQWCATVP